MDKGGGWGLTLESNPINNSNSNSNSNNNNSFLRLKKTMNGDNNNTLLHFPVSLNGKEEITSTDDDDRLTVNEVDFFNKDLKHHNVKKEYFSHGGGDDAFSKAGQFINTGLHLLTAYTGSDQSTVDNGSASSSEIKDLLSKNEQLTQMKVQLHRMNSENEKLKQMLTQVTNNYNALQFHIATLVQQKQVQVPNDDKAITARQFMAINPSSVTADNEQVSISSSEERTKSASPPTNNNENGKRIGREESPESETWGANSKNQKLMSPNDNNNKGIDQVATEATMRKARVSVRARSEAPMISDGCQWRKYGQKIAKGNPCPRAYYRCTMAVGCPVRKQVQRCAEDRTILITSYEGNHNHPLPPAAMAMASTTTAAASMLLSGSMSSADAIMNPNMLARAILPNCSNAASLSMATISASAPFPTVTLDLTHSPNSTNNPLQFPRQPAPQFQVPVLPGSGSGQLPQGFGQTLYNQSKFSGLQLSQGVEPSQLLQAAQSNQALNSRLSAITADPNFTAVLAEAIRSIMHNNNGNTPQQ
ncbi:hypothetical protein ACFE04_002488 [Oxalis oulophora]